MKTGSIYRIWNRNTGMSYIGQTVISVKYRINKHFRCHDGCYLHNAIQKHGKDIFESEIIESNIPNSQLDDRERFWIQQFDCVKPNGYNLTKGGKGASDYKHSIESRQKISKSRIGKKPANYGKKHSVETRQKISEAAKGRKHSLESRKKMSEARKGRVAWNKGKKHSPESIRKMSEAKQGKKHNNYGKNHSIESRKKMSEAKQGKKHPNYGKKHSDDTLRKMSEARRKRNTKKSSPLQLKLFE